MLFLVHINYLIEPTRRGSEAAQALSVAHIVGLFFARLCDSEEESAGPSLV